MRRDHIRDLPEPLLDQESYRRSSLLFRHGVVAAKESIKIAGFIPNPAVPRSVAKERLALTGSGHVRYTRKTQNQDGVWFCKRTFWGFQNLRVLDRLVQTTPAPAGADELVDYPAASKSIRS